MQIAPPGREPHSVAASFTTISENGQNLVASERISDWGTWQALRMRAYGSLGRILSPAGPGAQPLVRRSEGGST